MPSVANVQVTFWKFGDGRFSMWEADRGKRRLVPGTVWADAHKLTHDLAGLVVEATLPVSWGFWSCVAAGATFASTGRRRTKPGRDVIRAHRGQLDDAERTTHRHVEAWERGEPTPAARALDAMWVRWSALDDYEPLVVVWPSLNLVATDPVATQIQAHQRPPPSAPGEGAGLPLKGLPLKRTPASAERRAPLLAPRPQSAAGMCSGRWRCPSERAAAGQR